MNAFNTDLVEYNTATELATVFQDATAKIRELLTELGAQTQRLTDAFAKTDAFSSDFELRIRFDADDYDVRNPLKVDKILRYLNRNAWRTIIKKLELEKLMSASQAEDMKDSLYSRGERRYSGRAGAPVEMPPITAENIMAVLGGFIQDAPNMLAAKIREEFTFWRPSQMAAREHKTSRPNLDRLGKKLIRKYVVSWCGTYSTKSGFRPQYDQDKHVIALDSIFHALDGRGPMNGHYGPLSEAIRTCEGGKGETEYFRFKCFKNGNLHLEFKRLDLLKLFNRCAGGGALGDDFKRASGGEMIVPSGKEVA